MYGLLWFVSICSLTASTLSCDAAPEPLEELLELRDLLLCLSSSEVLERSMIFFRLSGSSTSFPRAFEAFIFAISNSFNFSFSLRRSGVLLREWDLERLLQLLNVGEYGRLAKP